MIDISKRDKKAGELAILRVVYLVADYPKVTASEEPDFIIKKKGIKFGVELTNYYQHGETGGRIANDKNYLNRLIDDGTVHPRDRDIVEVVNVGMDIGDRAILSSSNLMYTPILPANDRLKKLATDIENKNRLYKHYNKDLEYIDLLIYDDGDLSKGTEDRHIIEYLKSLQEKNEAQLDTPFENIYIYSHKPGSRTIIHSWKASP
jgi:hypothetical protein